MMLFNNEFHYMHAKEVSWKSCFNGLYGREFKFVTCLDMGGRHVLTKEFLRLFSGIQYYVCNPATSELMLSSKSLVESGIPKKSLFQCDFFLGGYDGIGEYSVNPTSLDISYNYSASLEPRAFPVKKFESVVSSGILPIPDVLILSVPEFNKEFFRGCGSSLEKVNIIVLTVELYSAWGGIDGCIFEMSNRSFFLYEIIDVVRRSNDSAQSSVTMLFANNTIFSLSSKPPVSNSKSFLKSPAFFALEYSKNQLKVVDHLISSKRFNEAIDICKDTLSCLPECIPVYLKLARIFISNRRYDEADDILNSSISIDPICPQCFHLLGRVNFEKGNFGLAKRFLLRSIEMNDSMAANYYYMYRIHRLKGDYGKSLYFINLAIEKNPSIKAYRSEAEEFSRLANNI